jgi:hypothetical protein
VRPALPTCKLSRSGGKLGSLYRRRRAWALASARIGRNQGSHRSEGRLCIRGVRYLEERGLGDVIDRPDGDWPRPSRRPAAVRPRPARHSKAIALARQRTSRGTGELVAMQVRDVSGHRRVKVMFPYGSRVAGSLFADREALRLFRGEAHPACPLVVCEGLSDFWSMAGATALPVCASPAHRIPTG